MEYTCSDRVHHSRGNINAGLSACWPAHQESFARCPMFVCFVRGAELANQESLPSNSLAWRTVLCMPSSS